VSADDQLVDVEDGGVAVVEDEVMPQTFGSNEVGLGLEDGEELVVEVVDVSELEKKIDQNFITRSSKNDVTILDNI